MFSTATLDYWTLIMASCNQRRNYRERDARNLRLARSGALATGRPFADQEA
jgi:hypothetical protein